MIRTTSFSLLFVDDENDSPGDGADSDKPVLVVRMCLVEDIEVLSAPCEQGARLLERHADCLFRFLLFLDSSQMNLTR